jgi:chaperonin cofactor prefoldin
MEKQHESQLEQFEKEFEQLEAQGEHLAERTVELRAQLTKQFGIEFSYVRVPRKNR